MATLEQVKTLEFIEQKRKLAKNKEIPVAAYLSSGHDKYKSTLNTFISIGSLSIVASCLGAVWAALGLAAMLSQNVNMTALDWATVIFEFAVYIVSIELGTKLYRLDVTPNFALASLIVLLALNVIVFMGILPCFTVIFSIIGLVRWSTYKNWFNAITNSLIKKRKTNNKTKLKTQPSDLERYFLEEDEQLISDQKSTNTPWIITIVILSILVIGGSVGFYFLGRSHGYDDGAWKGYNVGYEDGETDGYRSGFSGGEAAGQSYGYNTGYDAGYNDGYKRAGCVVFGGSLCY